jgi:uncharacterized membrane protein YjjP (DUF1212 family)
MGQVVTMGPVPASDTQKSLDLALRVGEMLLANGAGAADVTATMSSITHHLGLRQAIVDVTFTMLTIAHQGGPDEAPIALRRNVTQREIDYADLTAVDHLVADLLSDRITRDEAAQQVLQLASSGHPTPRWAVTASWGVVGAGVALLLGGDWIVLLVAALAGGAIEVLQRRLARFRLPFFYSQVAGGLLATLLAVARAGTHVPRETTVGVSGRNVKRLGGPGVIGAKHGAVNGL